jgi:hypothetical protein
MYHWERIIDLTQHYKNLDAGGITYKELATIVSFELEKIGVLPNRFFERERLRLIKHFQSASTNLVEALFEDQYMIPLYDWADVWVDKHKRTKFCWVKIQE